MDLTSSFKIVKVLYLTLLGLTFGASIFAGAFTTSVIFHANDYITSFSLSHFAMGELMSEIFRRLSYLVTLSVGAIVLFEGYHYFKKEQCGILLILAIVAVISGFLFSFYFIPTILEMQLEGSSITSSNAFESIHRYSEMVFKFFTFSILGLLMTHQFKALTKQ